jgi:class 3 adenylate cyclase
MADQNEEKEFLEFMVHRSVKRGSTDAAFGFLIYNSFAVWDWIVAPQSFKTLWAIRLSITLLWLAVVWFHNHPLIQSNLRFIYLGLLHLVLNSMSLIYYIAFENIKQLDFLFAFLVLPYAMSAFHIRVKDSLILGVGFIISFSTMIFLKASNPELIMSNLSALAVAFSVGIAGAIVGERYGRRSFVDQKLLQAETNRADNLLIKTFPFEVAKELKLNHTSQAKRFDDVTVMFCDIVNFTDASAQMSPEELVSFLNQTFSAFDRMTADHGCEKIKTIGDSYMAVCGVPIPTKNHAERIIRLALALHDAAANMTLGDKPLLLRIGVNSGPVVAGVIGESRFAYDLWGDTVNTASRMESLAPVGAIRITESTKNEIDDTFILQELPESPVKGKGLMKSWIVIGLKQLSAEEIPGSTHVAA